MAKIKSHKTVEQIAKKHRLDVSFIQKQLNMGEPIEHEHTKDHKLAMDIALQHLDEIPDYYSRLKKMEADAKKHHKKFKDVKEEIDGLSALGDLDTPIHMHPVHGVHIDYEKRYCPKCKKVELRSECKNGSRYWDLFSLPEKLKEETMHEDKRYCPLCDKREKRSECSYGEKAWDKVSVKDEEYSMARSQLKNIDDAVNRLMMKIGKGEGNLEAWVQSKITLAADYIDTVSDYVASGEMEESRSPLVDKILQELEEGKGLWDNIHARRKAGKPRKKPGEKGYPKTLDIDEDLEQAKTNVGASKCWKTKKVGNPPTKMKGGKEVPNCVPKESVTIQDADGNDYVEFIDLVKPDPIKSIAEATRLEAQTGNLIAVLLSWRAKTYSLTMFFPQVKMPSRKEVEEEIQKVYPGSRVLQFRVTTTRGEQPIVQVQNTKSKNYLLQNKTIGEDVELEEAKKSEMACNKPKAEAHGHGETGKSHVVKACENGQEKLIRFGQLGVKGSPKKKGESKAYAMRRHRFQTRHAKNIAKGKMSAAYWANKVKW